TSRPFVRLAVARYQPYALKGMKLSDITLVDYLQLSDDRELVITRDTKDDRKLHIALYGITHDATQSIAPARLSCWLEERCAEQLDGKASWIAGSATVSWQRTIREGRACWYTSIQAATPLSCGKYRLSVLEEESYLLETDESANGGIPVYF